MKEMNLTHASSDSHVNGSKHGLKFNVPVQWIPMHEANGFIFRLHDRAAILMEYDAEYVYFKLLLWRSVLCSKSSSAP